MIFVSIISYEKLGFATNIFTNNINVKELEKVKILQPFLYLIGKHDWHRLRY